MVTSCISVQHRAHEKGSGEPGRKPYPSASALFLHNCKYTACLELMYCYGQECAGSEVRGKAGGLSKTMSEISAWQPRIHISTIKYPGHLSVPNLKISKNSLWLSFLICKM